MPQHLILPASFLILAAVIVVAIARDPAGFSLKDWQTITASFIALGAATLAYSAAMAKVRLDEATAKEEDRRKALGLFLRFDFAVDVLRYEADELLKGTSTPANPSENTTVEVDSLSLSEMPEIADAWENLDLFPVELSRTFYDLRNDLYNFAQFKKDNAGESYPLDYGMATPGDLAALRDILTDISSHARTALARVRDETRGLRNKPV